MPPPTSASQGNDQSCRRLPRLAQARNSAYAKNAVWHGLTYSFAQRKDKKADYRSLWTVRINAACLRAGITYSRFIQA